MKTGAKTALFGGSFNPPHCGHVEFVEALAADEQFEEIWVIPCADHAFGKELAPFEDRMEMCRLAFVHISDRIQIRNDEQQMEGTSYTVNLIRFLKNRNPEKHFVLVLGSDNYTVRQEWRDFDAIEEMVEVLFYGRKGWQEANDELELNTPFPNVSSTKIRERLQAGESLSGLVPNAVSRYINKKGLY